MESHTKSRNKELRDFAKELRRNMTKQEKHLWYDYLRNYPIKIYKQRIIENYIADFYGHQAKLVIEIDGSQHYSEEGERCDEARDLYLYNLGYTVLRYTNLEIERNFNGVCADIEQRLAEYF